ncbi:MAG: TolC family protein [Desulfobacteraceae bacterium]|nr:TolC family protein [Desulfobacteraceae bacterium]
MPNPQVSSRLVGEFRQPLLRNLDDRQNRSAMNIAGLNLGIARDDLNKAVISVVSETIKGYWQLAYARELVEVNRRSHEMAEEVCRRESVRKDRGLSRPIDVDRARSAMQIRLSQLKRSQSDAYNVSEQLKLLLNIPSLPVGSLFQIVPTEAPQSSGAAVDRDEALAVAIANRTEMEHARKAIEVGRVRKDLAGHLRLPKLDAVSTLSLNGLGSHLNEGFQDEYLRERYSWAVGLELEWPIGNRKAEADYRKETYGFEQALADLKRITQQVLLEIGIAIRQLEVEEEQIKTTRLAKEAAQYVVNGENVRFELGQTTNDELLRAQDILAVAEREYIQSVMNYNVGLMNLAQAQGTLLNSFKIKVEGP